MRYVDGVPTAIEKLLISTQHADSATRDRILDDLWEHVVLPVLPADMFDENELRREFLVNPTGRFVIGGPVGDCGLTGRKIIVDTYGGMARHGGGAFSGKDPSKVDRSAAYAARWVAKNIVAAGLADRCEVQVAYAIGVAHPVSVMVETFGTEKIWRERIAALVDEHFDLRPGAFRQELRPAPADLPEDRRVRALRPRRRGLHVGADRQGRPAARRRRPHRARGGGLSHGHRRNRRRGPDGLGDRRGGRGRGPARDRPRARARARCDASEARIGASLAKAVDRGKLDPDAAAAAADRIVRTTRLRRSRRMRARRRGGDRGSRRSSATSSAELDERLAPEVILASNTSSIPITTLAQATTRPGPRAGAALLLARPGHGARRDRPGLRRRARRPSLRPRAWRASSASTRSARRTEPASS